MTTTEWDGTPWGGTVVETGTTTNRAKAVMGWQNIWTPDRLPVAALSRSPMKRMRTEQALYWTHPWVLTAENAVTRRVAGLPWHIEDDNDDEVEDETPDPRLKAIRLLLEKPQAALPVKERQVGIASWTNLIGITSRHLGLCGMTHWFLDGRDGDGIPNAILYINPARLFPHTTTSGQLIEWILDPKDDWGRGGTALDREQVLTFYLTPPDGGAVASGMVQAAYTKTRLSTSADTHALTVFGSGGQIAGIVSPKLGTLEDEQYGTLTNELRNIQEAGDSAQRLAVIRGPVEFHATTATMQELDVAGLSGLSRDDILTVWGVPASQAPVSTAVGLNGGETKGYDEAILYQGAVHDRVRTIRETVQLGLLDLFNAVGLNPQLVIEEPTYDDDAPAYELAAKTKELPLTRNEVRAIIKLDPLPEYGPDGEPLGLAIDLPLGLQVVGQGEEAEKAQPEGRFGKAPLVKPEPTPPAIFPNPVPMLTEGIAKASQLNRAAVVGRFEPALRKSVAAFLAEQGAEIAQRIRDRGEHIARKPSDRSVWWDEKRWDDRLMAALKVGVAGVSAQVATKITAQLGSPAKASFAETIAERILIAVGRRIRGINETTRDVIGKLIGEAFDQGLSPGQVADLITDATSFDAARAELIARTETAQAYNDAALQSYREYDVTLVEAIDGDDDDECRERQELDSGYGPGVYTVEDAEEIEDHPNGTLAWSPIYTPAKATQKIRMERDETGAWVLEEIA